MLTNPSPPLILFSFLSFSFFFFFFLFLFLFFLFSTEFFKAKIGHSETARIVEAINDKGSQARLKRKRDQEAERLKKAKFRKISRGEDARHSGNETEEGSDNGKDEDEEDEDEDKDKDNGKDNDNDRRDD